MLIFEVNFQKKLHISITTYMISSANIDSVTYSETHATVATGGNFEVFFDTFVTLF